MSINYQIIVKLVCWAAIVFFSSASQLWAIPRTEVSLFKYRGAQEGQLSGVKFEVFRGILDRKILKIRREILQTATLSEDLLYLKEVRIDYRNEDTFETEGDVENWMKLQARTLGVLRGSIVSDDDNTYVVFSEFHLRIPQSFLPYNVITVQLPVKSSEFANSKDSHSVVILYALALDAKRIGMDGDQIVNFLRVATNKIADIKRRSGSLPQDLQFIESSINKIASELLNESGDNE